MFNSRKPFTMKTNFITILLLLGTLSLKAQQVSIPNNQANDTTIYNKVDKDPEYNGGVEKLNKFLSDNLIYPKDDGEQTIQGKVIVTFIIEKDGSLSNLKIVRGLSPKIDKESLRVLMLSPNWIPGFINGYPVRCLYTLPLQFSFEK